MKQAKYDVVIVGSGAGGGTAAWALSKAGLKVLVLEAGPHYSPEKDYHLHSDDWEKPFQHKAPLSNSPIYAEMQSLSSDYNHLRSWNHISGRLNKTEKRISFGYHRVQGVGGSSLHYTGEAHRMNPQSMQMKSKFGVAADWPISYDELEPYYQLAEHTVGVAGANEDKHRPRSKPYSQKFHPFSYATTVMGKGFNKNGMKLVPNSLAVLSSAVGDRPPCNYCGGCLRGCPRNDKGTIDITYLKMAQQSGNCEIISEAVAKQIETGTNDTITGVHYEQNNKLHFVSAPITIIACGAVETPRLLLSSENSQSPDGLGNESGQVGQNFMETLLWSSNGMHTDSLGSHRGLPVDAICWDYNAPDAIPDVIGGCRFGPSQAESDLVGPKSYATRVVAGWGKSHKQKMRDNFGKAVSLTGICESLPNEKTFVSLADAKDSSGMPLPMINSYVDNMAIKRIEFMAKTSREILKASGVDDIFEEFSSYDAFSSSHVFGTCRMGKNAEDSVVNEWCRSHRWNNLYVIDASVFPSSGGGESPGLTIQALALRAAENIASLANA